MHDNGLYDLGNGRGQPTLLQKTAYVMAKSYWTEKQREDAENSSDSTTVPSSGTTERKFDWSKEMAQDNDSSEDETNPLFEDRDSQEKFVEMKTES